MWYHKLLFTLSLGLLVGHHLCQAPPEQVQLDDLIKNIFNTNKDFNQNNNNNNQPPVSTTERIFVPTPTKTTVLNPVPPPNQETKYKSCGFEKECVPRFLCQNDTINTDGTNIIDIRTTGEDCGYLEVCCDIPNKRDTPVIDPKPEETHIGCGYRNPYGVGFRITGSADQEAEFGEFPWMVAILREEEAAGEILNLYECGGALIAPNAIVTAAHCVKNHSPHKLQVRAGEWDTQSKAEVLPYQDLPVKEIIVHEQFNKGSLFNDVGILILDGNFEWAENIRPLCLPPSNENFDHSRCYATGWGKDQFGKDGKYQVILKKIDLPIMPRDTCQKNLRTTRLGAYFQLHESFICAGGEKGKDTCKGDGGSPLVCPIPGVKDRFYHAGIVAWGIGCGEQNIPGVYASIPYMRQWLNDKLSSRGIDFKHFTV